MSQQKNKTLSKLNNKTQRVKTESNNLGTMKTLIILTMIVAQLSILALTYLYLIEIFRWYFSFSVMMTILSCIHVLSSNYHGQAKATWILFFMISFGFGYIIYLLSDKRVQFAKSRKKINNILQNNNKFKVQNTISNNISITEKTNCDLLYNLGKFQCYTNSITTFYTNGKQLWGNILNELEKAQNFIFIEFYIISNGKLFDRIFNILKSKVKHGVDVRIIYDDMGSHGSLKRNTKKQLIKSGIKIQPFNRLVPIFNISLNLRDHRKLVIIDGKISFTGGSNLSDEYTNERQIHGYWKDEGIKIEGPATDNFTISCLEQWEFLSGVHTNLEKFINKSKPRQKTDGIVVPFVSGPNYESSIAEAIYTNLIANAQEKLYIMSPYFIPSETILNLISNKAKCGVDVKLILPGVADKKLVYIVSRNNAEKLLDVGVRLYTMNNSFVHSKIVYTESNAVVGSINMDLRSFNQQFESAVYSSEKHTLLDIEQDFENTIKVSTQIKHENKKRNKLSFRAKAGLLNIISPFM